ncbi:helix-turn-helix domain-containing protein [Nonomuraea sp. NPDC050153]|uniref:helix-turn-helix domain-containing protein n=1 Tax=Nonomuraea sp. NPDC050153 TaxID=3364359 RepID=UPI0037AFF6BE
MQDRSAEARKAFGIRLRDLRRDAGLNGKQLAARTGLHPTKVSRIEHARQNPSEDDIRAWCSACGTEAHIPELIAVYRDVQRMWTEYRETFRKKRKVRRRLDRRARCPHRPRRRRLSPARTYSSVTRSMARSSACTPRHPEQPSTTCAPGYEQRGTPPRKKLGTHRGGPMGKHDDDKKPSDEPLPKPKDPPSKNGQQPGGQGDGKHAGGKK